MFFSNTKLEWFGKIPPEWKVSKIKYIHAQTKNSFTDGDWIESSEIVDTGIRYITTGNIGEGKFKYQGKGYINEQTFERLNCTEIFEGDLLISRLSPPVGRSCILPDLGNRAVTSVDNVVLRLNKDFSKEFYNFVFNSVLYFEHTETLSRGSTLTRISRNILGNIKVLVPPVEEQQLISKYLYKKTQKIDFLIEKIEKKIQLLKEQKDRTIINYFTRMRYLDKKGSLMLDKKDLKSQKNYIPWFKQTIDNLDDNEYIIFGHWAALNGKTKLNNIIGLDTGCVWGKKLTAIRLEDKKIISVKNESI